MLLNPLGRANETPFFSIPGSKDNVSLGLPACILELLEGSSELDEDSRSGVGVSVAALKQSVIKFMRGGTGVYSQPSRYLCGFQ